YNLITSCRWLIDFVCTLIFFIFASSPWFFTLSLHDALPILDAAEIRFYLRLGDVDRRRDDVARRFVAELDDIFAEIGLDRHDAVDRKSTRLNSSHVKSSYAVFCLKKKNYDITMYNIAHVV